MRSDLHLRISDADRDETVELLRDHLLAGRLDPDEHEERVAEACRAKYGRDLEHALRELPAPPTPAGAVVAAPPVFVKPRDESGSAAIAFGIAAMVVLLFTGGFGAILALPLGVTGWVLATRSERRRGLRLGIAATVLSVIALVVWMVWLVLGVAVFLT